MHNPFANPSRCMFVNDWDITLMECDRNGILMEDIFQFLDLFTVKYRLIGKGYIDTQIFKSPNIKNKI